MRSVHLELRDRLNFLFERFLVRGAFHRLLFIAGVIGMLSLSAGAIVLRLGEFTSIRDAVWWAFLRLTDPGYLGDDVGLWPRVVSTVLTVLGYVVFLGALVAIMTQWLNKTLERLELGLTPLAMRDHVVILGWTKRVKGIVQNLVQSDSSVRRWLRRRGVRRLRIAILAPRVTPALDQDLRDWLGSDYRADQIVLRSGSPQLLEHLRRVNIAAAAAIVLPGEEFDAAEDDLHDARVLKTLLSVYVRLSQEDEELPMFVAEMFERGRLKAARQAYLGPLEVVVSNKLVGELLANEVLQPGLGRIYAELLSHARGPTLQLRDEPQLAGIAWDEAQRWFPRGGLLGFVAPAKRSFSAVLNPAPDVLLQPDHRLIVAAQTHDDAAAVDTPRPMVELPELPLPDALPPAPSSIRRVLLIGWNRKVPHVLAELSLHGDPPPRITMLSRMPTADRRKMIRDSGVLLGPLEVCHAEGDPTVAATLRAIDATDFDAVLFLANDWLDRNEDADARTIASLLLFAGLVRKRATPPHVVVELLDTENAPLVASLGYEALVSNRILSHILGQVVLRRELRAAIEALLGGGDGTEVRLIAARSLGLADTRLTFDQLRAAMRRLGCTAIGVRHHNAHEAILDPSPDRVITLRGEDCVIVLAPEPVAPARTAYAESLEQPTAP